MQINLEVILEKSTAMKINRKIKDKINGYKNGSNL